MSLFWSIGCGGRIRQRRRHRFCIGRMCSPVTFLIAACVFSIMVGLLDLRAEDLAAPATLQFTSPTPASQLSTIGTFYSARHPDWPPFPANVHDLPAWALGNGCFLLADADFDYEAFAESMEAVNYTSGEYPMISRDYASDDLWISLNAVVNGRTDFTADLTIHTPGTSTSASWDLYYARSFDWQTDWNFLMRCPTNIIGQTNVYARYLPDEIAFFMARETTTNCDLIVTTNVTPQQMVEMLVPPWVTVTNVNYTGAAVARGIFTNGNCCGLPIAGGVILSSGYITDAAGPNDVDNKGDTVGGPPDADLNLLVGGSDSKDAAILEFDVISTNACLLKFRYVYASEEYPEYSGSMYCDPFAIFVTTNRVETNWINTISNNIALVPVDAHIPVTVYTVNGGYEHAYEGVIPTNAPYYVDNHDPYNQAVSPYSIGEPVFNIQYDGMTVLLAAQTFIDACTTSHIKIAISDYTDERYDSAVFLDEWSHDNSQ